MISILIPVYNYDASELVISLDNQCKFNHLEYEIICLDDCSNSHFQSINKKLNQISPNVIYRYLPFNYGRAKIRNKLATEAKYEYLLFLDCDSKVISADFVQKYIQFAQKTAVVCGGTAYSQEAPSDQQLMLHWLYGSKREVIPAEIRNKHPYNSFKTNNFAIPRSLFGSIFFDEKIVEYGHEDTLFGLELKKLRVSIIHIDNPVLHVGLDPYEKYISKTNQAISNLVKIERNNKAFKTRLLKHYHFIKKFHLLFILDITRVIFEKNILRELSSKKPMLKLLDLYKLCKLREFYKNEDLHR